MSLADQVEALAEIVRVLAALSALQLLVTVWLARRVSRLRLTVRALTRRVRESGRKLDELDEHVREAIEGDITEVEATARRALRIARKDAAEEEREFIRRTERPRANGSGE